MLNPLPELLAFRLLAPFLLRVALGLLFLNAGVKKLRKQSWITGLFEQMHLRPAGHFAALFGVVEILAGISLITGLYTQIAALVTLCISIFALYAKRKFSLQTPGSKGVFFLMIVISLSLIFSGAGFFAFDRPL